MGGGWLGGMVGGGVRGAESSVANDLYGSQSLYIATLALQTYIVIQRWA